MVRKLNISPSYISHLRLHLADVQAHLAGETGDVLLPSFIPPAGYWTSSEKNSFFRALTRYSRARPDLIAAHIKTKSVVDVCAYIDQLHNASNANPIPWTRKDVDIAFEVPESWVKFEERNANSLIMAEPLWDDEQCRTSRQAEVDKKRRDLTSDAFDDWKMVIEDQWDRQDSLKCLDTLQLNTLESILRTGDPSTTPTNHARDNELVEYQVSNESNEVPLDLGSAVTNSTDPLPFSTPFSPSISPTSSSLPPLPDDVHPAPQTPAPTGDQASTQPSLSASPRDRLTPRDPAPQTPPKGLSPASRRRLQKRLYMRRKRAELSGGEVNYAAVRLPPGRERQKTRSKPKFWDDEERRIEQAAKEKQKKSGMTKPHKIRQQFAKQRIDLSELQRIGLGLFHLSALGGLIELYKFGYAETKGDIITSISADTICLLGAVAIDFMTEIIHRAIVFKNQEFRRKGDIKAWRLGQKEISGDDIYSCLEMMGLKDLTKKTYFEQLLRYRSDSDALSTCGSGAEECELEDRMTMTDCYLPICILSAQDTSFFTNEDGTSLMPINIDERALVREIAEEEELQQFDEALIKEHESKLRQSHSLK